MGLTAATVVSLAAVVFISTIYLVIRPEPWINGFVSLFPAGWRQRTREVLQALYQTVQRWFLGQLAAMTFIAVFWAISLSLIGVPFALLIGIFSGLISFIPYLGALISIVIPVLLALISDPFSVVWVILAFVIIQQIEGNLLQPIIMSRAVDLHPALVVFAILVMGTLFGIVGVFLAVPLVAALQVLVRELWVQKMDQMGTDPNPPAREPPQTRTPRPNRQGPESTTPLTPCIGLSSLMHDEHFSTSARALSGAFTLVSYSFTQALTDWLTSEDLEA